MIMHKPEKGHIMTQSHKVLCSHISFLLSFSGMEIFQYVSVFYLEQITLYDYSTHVLESSIPFMVNFLVDHSPFTLKEGESMVL